MCVCVCVCVCACVCVHVCACVFADKCCGGENVHICAYLLQMLASPKSTMYTLEYCYVNPVGPLL